jgi:hypothetical protein
MATNMSTITLMVGNGEIDQLSNPARGDGYYGYREGFHTIAVQFNQFLGRVQIEATLDINPTEADWFPVWILPSTPYKQYSTPKTGNEAFMFRGNFVLVRFRKIRSYLTDTSSIGDITKVMLSI